MGAPELFERDLAERLHALDRPDRLNVALEQVLVSGRRRVVRRRVGMGAGMAAGIAAVGIAASVIGGAGRSQTYPAVPAPSATTSASAAPDVLSGCVGNLAPVSADVFLCEPAAPAAKPFLVDNRGKRLPHVADARLARGMWLFETAHQRGGPRLLVGVAPGSAQQVRFVGASWAEAAGAGRSGNGPWVASLRVPGGFDPATVDLTWRDAAGDLFSARAGRARGLGFGATTTMVRFEIVPVFRFFEVTSGSGFRYAAVLGDTPRVVSGEVNGSDPFVMVVIPGRASRVVMPADSNVETTSVSTAGLNDVDVTVAYLALDARPGAAGPPESASWTDAAGKRWTITFADESVRPAD